MSQALGQISQALGRISQGLGQISQSLGYRNIVGVINFVNGVFQLYM